jgi:hypothetical protein
MKSIKQFQNEQHRIFASVVSEPKQGLLMDIWNGKTQSIEDLMKVLGYSLHAIHEHQLECWLSDVSKLEALFDFDNEAVGSFLIRKLKDSSLRKFAFINRRSHKQANGHNLDRLVRIFIDAGVEVKICRTSVLAMQWLLMPTLVKKTRPVLEI